MNYKSLFKLSLKEKIEDDIMKATMDNLDTEIAIAEWEALQESLREEQK